MTCLDLFDTIHEIANEIRCSLFRKVMRGAAAKGKNLSNRGKGNNKKKVQQAHLTHKVGYVVPRHRVYIQRAAPPRAASRERAAKFIYVYTPIRAGERERKRESDPAQPEGPSVTTAP